MRETATCFTRLMTVSWERSGAVLAVPVTLARHSGQALSVFSLKTTQPATAYMALDSIQSVEAAHRTPCPAHRHHDRLKQAWHEGET